MSSKPNEDSMLKEIDSWYHYRCNGQWEHQLGITIESTDNPGWLATIGDLELEKHDLADVIGKLLLDHNAQVITDGSMVRIFSATLEDCINALTIILRLDINPDKKSTSFHQK